MADNNKKHKTTPDQVIKELTKDGDILIEFVADDLKPDKKQLTPTNKEQESIKNISKLSTLDKEILTIAKDNPNYNNHQIGTVLENKGLSKNKVSIYSRLKYSELLRSEIDKVRTHNHEYLAREIIPEALKIHKKVLKDKAIAPKDKDTWVSMAYKAGLKTEPADQAAKVISIGQINILQQMGRDDTEVIEGEVVDSTGDKE